LEQLVSLGYKNADECRKKILDNGLCEVVAIYHLLLDRVVEEEMTEIKKKLMHKKTQPTPTAHKNGETENMQIDPRERRLSSPTRAVNIPKLAAIPEDDYNDTRGSGPWGWGRHKHDGKHTSAERGFSVVDGRGELTRSAPLHRPERAAVAKQSSVACAAVVDVPAPAGRWQHRRSSVACGPSLDSNRRAPPPPPPQNQKAGYGRRGWNPPLDTNACDRRKFSLDSRAFTEQMAQESAGETHVVGASGTNGEKKLSSSPPAAVIGPRLVRGVFKSSTTTSLAPEEAAKTVKKSLGLGDLFVKRKSPYVFLCFDEESGVKFQLEVCKISQLDLTGIHLKRISGDIWKYKTLCNELVTDMKL